MCRNITELRGLEPPATREEIEAAARQYIRKVTGIAKPNVKIASRQHGRPKAARHRRLQQQYPLRRAKVPEYLARMFQTILIWGPLQPIRRLPRPMRSNN